MASTAQPSHMRLFFETIEEHNNTFDEKILIGQSKNNIREYLPQGLDFKVIHNKEGGTMPFSAGLIEKVMNGTQSISIRDMSYFDLNKNGIYKVTDKNGKTRAFKVTSLKHKSSNTKDNFTLKSYLAAYPGLTKEQLFKATGITGNLTEELQKFFDNTKPRNVLHIEDITDRLGEFKEIENSDIFNCA
jgi:hypothetical protein